ncbi:MAG: hypothetical protein CFE45_16110 [Burkholderiales bacterium PBB5]|nr:MAG: hypothetical protein CFE45_16110 [Burkholderiales bacterium PBB5]
MTPRTLPIALLACLLAAAPGFALAKLPAPSDEAKAKADEAKAKTAHGDKLAAFQLCNAMNRVAGSYQAATKKAGKPASAPTDTPACADPGPFGYTPPGAASAPAVASAPAAAAAAKPAAPAPTVAKK